MKYLSSALTLIALFVALACGPSGNDACAKYFEARYSSDCYLDVPSPSGRPAVEARFVAACENLMALPGTSFTPAFAEACADAVPTVGCVPIELQYGACATQPGALPVGAACQQDSQCASTICSASGECGTCLPTVPAGGDCSALGSMCVAGTGCDRGTCTAPTIAKLGETCDDNWTFCEKNSICWNGVCSPPQGLNEPCFRWSDCEAGLQCSNPTLQGGTCISGPTPTYASSGAACSADVPCLVGICSDATNGTCPIPIADGQPCNPTSGTPCDAWSMCIDGTCRTDFSTSCQ